MTQLSWKKLLVGFLVVLLLSRTGRILEFLKELDLSGILTLEPLRRTPEDGRCLMTLALGALGIVLLHSWFFRGRK
jgi:hypothetical protein